MKKHNILIASAVALIVGLSACSGGGNIKTSVPQLKNEADSLNYAFGMANGTDMKMMLPGDSIESKVKLFIRGLEKGLSGKIDEHPEFAEVGGQVGGWLAQQKERGLLNDSDLTVNYALVRQGLINAIVGDKMQMTAQEAQEYVNNVMKGRHEQRMLEKYGDNKAAGEKYLQDNAGKPGVVTTASGLQYLVIKEGSGEKPKATDRVKVHYEGKLINDTIFDSSIKNGEPVEFMLNHVIAGWTEGVQLMPVGSTYRFFIPQNLAYGADENHPNIPPFSTLVFDVQLIEIKK